MKRGSAIGYAAWQAAIEQLDPTPKTEPIAPADLAALENPVTLADHLDPNYEVREHLRVIGREIKAVHDGDGDRLQISLPPQIGKTTSAIEWAAFWWLCKNPTHKIIVVSYNDILAVDRGAAIRRLVELYGARYGLYLDPSARAKHAWNLTSGGRLRAVGIGSTLAGVPGDVVFIDDPHKNWEECESIVMRTAVHNAYAADIQTRLAPFKPIVLVQTRWSDDDLAGRRIREEGRTETGGRWRVVSMPALCTDPENDPLGRKAGEPLPHPKIPEGDTAACLRWWESIKRSQPARVWYALYQCDPRPAEGGLLTWELLRQRRCYEHGNTGCAQPTRTGVGIDPSGGGRDTAGIIGGYLGEDDRAYLTHDWSGVMPSDMWGRKACEMAVEIDADFFVIESNYGGDQALLVLRTAWESLRREQPERYSVFCPRVIEVKAKKGKLLRAEPIAQQFVEDKARTANYLPDVEAEYVTWQPDSKVSPGRIDASVYLLYELLPVPPSGHQRFSTVEETMIDLTRGLSPGDIGMIR